MKFSTLATVLAAGTAMAAPTDLEKRATAINYVQNYNGNLANFQYNQGAGTFSASWNNPGDFVVGLGWQTGTQRSVASSVIIVRTRQGETDFNARRTGASPSAARTPPTKARTMPYTAGSTAL